MHIYAVEHTCCESAQDLSYVQPLEAHSRDTIQSVQAFLHILVSDPGDHDSGQILTESIFMHLCMQLGACSGITRQTSTALGYVKKVTPEPSVIAVLRHSLLDRLLHQGSGASLRCLALAYFSAKRQRGKGWVAQIRTPQRMS